MRLSAKATTAPTPETSDLPERGTYVAPSPGGQAENSAVEIHESADTDNTHPSRFVEQFPSHRPIGPLVGSTSTRKDRPFQWSEAC